MKKQFTILVVLVIILCLIQSAVLIFLTPPKTAEQNTNAVPIAEQAKPDWLVKYPQLNFMFIHKAESVDVIETFKSLFVLVHTNKVDDPPYQFWMVPKDDKDGSKPTLLYATELACGGISIGRDTTDPNLIYTDQYDSPCGPELNNHTRTYYDSYGGVAYSAGDIVYSIAYGDNVGDKNWATSSFNGDDRTILLAPKYDDDCDQKTGMTNFYGVSVTIPSNTQVEPISTTTKYYPAPHKIPMTCVAGEGVFSQPLAIDAVLLGKQFITLMPSNVTISIDTHSADPKPVFSF